MTMPVSLLLILVAASVGVGGILGYWIGAADALKRMGGDDEGR